MTGAWRPTTVDTVYVWAVPRSVAFHDTDTVASELTLAVTSTGAAGGPDGTTDLVSAAAPTPTAFTAWILNEYALPLLSPRIIVEVHVGTTSLDIAPPSPVTT